MLQIKKRNRVLTKFMKKSSQSFTVKNEGKKSLKNCKKSLKILPIIAPEKYSVTFIYFSGNTILSKLFLIMAPRDAIFSTEEGTEIFFSLVSTPKLQKEQKSCDYFRCEI